MKWLKYFLPVIVCALFVFSLVGESNASNDGVKPGNNVYYFYFTGSPGQEDDESLWVELEDEDAFDQAFCPGTKNGCVLATTSITGTSGVDARPSVVNTEGEGSEMTPITGGGVTDLRYRNFDN